MGVVALGGGLGREALGVHARCTVERVDLEPGVVGHHPAARVAVDEAGLGKGVALEGVFLLGRLGDLGVVAERAHIGVPLGEQRLNLLHLVGVVGGQHHLHGFAPGLRFA